MKLLSLFTRRHTPFFSPEEQSIIVSAVQEAELRTSGEVRVYAESKCSYVNPLDRAAEIFHNLQMQATQQRNAVLVYVALKDRQLALYADEGIYQKAGKDFWNTAVKKMLSHFNKEDYAQGIAAVVKEIGESLTDHFPYDGLTDKNELPDEIVFGK